MNDRAAVVTTAIMQMIATAPKRDLRQAIEAYLRGEFAEPRALLLTKFVMKTSSSPGACYPAMPMHSKGISHGKKTRCVPQ
jgi:hypothetical protein